MVKKFGFLRFVAIVYKAFGFVLLIGAVLGAIGIVLASTIGGSVLQNVGGEYGLQNTALFGGIFSGIIGAVVVLLSLGLAAMCQFAVSEAIMVFLAIEENTRATAGLLARQG